MSQASALLSLLWISALLPGAGGGVECHPYPPAVDTAYAMASAVFSGRVLTRDTPPHRPDAMVAVLQVHRAWKGEVGDRTPVWSLKGGEGFVFEPGKEYLVYASTGGDGDLWTSLCQRTALLDQAGEDLEWLGAIIYGTGRSVAEAELPEGVVRIPRDDTDDDTVKSPRPLGLDEA
ncbi:MAG: hypothetical protein AMXMBFR53_19920 [Gemmatimonadota bacterium]